MSCLKPIEFSDCVVDGPKFRDTLLKHEKEIDNANKAVKNIYNNLKNVFDCMQTLSNAYRDFATSLRKVSMMGRTWPNGSEDDTGETDDERVIREALGNYAKMIETIEDMRCEHMMGATKDLVMKEVDDLRKKWLVGTKNETKKFNRDTGTFCTKQEKYLSLKSKLPESTLKESDIAMTEELKNYVRSTIDHVQQLQDAQEETKNNFVSSISLLIQMSSTFHHQVWENFVDSKRKMDEINASAQRNHQSYLQIKEDTTQLRDEMLKNPLEGVQSSTAEPGVTRQGFLNIQTKKAMATSWVKNFCTYRKDGKIFTAVPFVQTGHVKANEEMYTMTFCTRRATETIDRRFCFDISLNDKNLTCQACSAEDLQLWITAMDGSEPIYANPCGKHMDAECTKLNKSGHEFVEMCLTELERRGLDEEGIYRLAASKVKLDRFVLFGLDERNRSRLQLTDTNEYDSKTLSCAVKHYIRHLSEPLMTYELHDKFIVAAKTKDPERRVKDVSELIKKLPEPNFKTLSLLIHHLIKVNSMSHINLMNAANLGVVFGPTLFRSVEASVAAIMDIKFAGVVVEILIQDSDQFFPITDPVAYAVTSVASSGENPVNLHRSSSTPVGTGIVRHAFAPNNSTVEETDEPVEQGRVKNRLASFETNPNDKYIRAILNKRRPPSPPGQFTRGTPARASVPTRRAPLASWDGDQETATSPVNSAGSTKPAVVMRPPRRPPAGPIVTGQKARALYPCTAESERELSFTLNQIIFNVRKSTNKGWLLGQLNGKEGLIPENYVEMLS